MPEIDLEIKGFFSETLDAERQINCVFIASWNCCVDLILWL